MARIRLILAPALILLCACAGSGASPALGAKARAHARVHHGATCAKSGGSRRRHHTRSASFRGAHHGRHATHCVRRRTTHRVVGNHHRTVGHPVGSHGSPRKSSVADASGGCADTELTPSALNVERVRAATLCLINRERAANGESPLQQNGRLEQAAQSHTESMAFGNYFEHIGPHGDTPLSRMRGSGYIYSSQIGYSIGENLAWGTFTQGTPRAIVAAWMSSPGHRANILDSHFRDTAIGVSPHVPSSFGHDQPGGIYTQDFGVIIHG